MGTEDQGQIENAHSAGKQHGSGDRLHGKFQIRTCAAEVIVDTETKNQAGRNIDAENCGGSEAIEQARKYERESQPHAEADRESQENRHAPQSGKRGLVNVPPVLRQRNPASAGCPVPHFTGSDKRYNQRKRKEPKEQQRQSYGSLPAETPGTSDHVRADVSVHFFRQGFPISGAV